MLSRAFVWPAAAPTESRTGERSMTRRRGIAEIAAAVSAALPLAAACGRTETAPRAPEPRARVEWWAPSSGANGPTVDRLVTAASAARNLDVTTAPQPIGIAEQSRAKFTAAVAAGTPPDLIYVDRYLVRSFGALQLIGSLDGYIKPSKTYKPTDFWPYLIKDVTWRAGIWGSPFTTDVRALYWNKAVFADAGLDPEKPPATWDALEGAADRMLKRNADGSLARAGFVPTWGNPPTFYAFFLYLWQLGGEFLSPDESKPAFNSAAGLKALEWMVKMVNKPGGLKALQPLSTGFDTGPGRDVFTAGRLGAQYQTSAVRQTYQEGVPDVKFGIGPLPLPAGGKPMNYAGGFAVAIPKAARQPEGAWRLAEQLATRESQIIWSVERSGIPVLKAVAASAEFQQGDAARKVFVDELIRGAKWVPTIVGTADVLSAFGTPFTAAINGDVAPRDALNQAASQVQVVLDQYKQYR